MLLAFDTSSAACTAALFDESGACVGRCDEIIGRGHSERLVAMIGELMDGRSASRILVGVGPGSFTGIRVAIAAAHGLAIGWGAEIRGMSSLALLAAGCKDDGQIVAAVTGGHGELFVQQFDSRTLCPATELLNAKADEAAQSISATLVVGSGAKSLVDARGRGEALELWPSAGNALRLPYEARNLPPRPIYARAPDARAPQAA